MFGFVHGCRACVRVQDQYRDTVRTDNKFVPFLVCCHGTVRGERCAVADKFWRVLGRDSWH